MPATVKNQGSPGYHTGRVVRASAPRDLPKIPPMKRRKRFTVGFLPTRWVHGDDGWVPQMIILQHVPGANGVEVRGEGPNAVVDATAYHVGFEKKGGRVVHLGSDRLPEDLRWYVAEVDLRGGGKHYTPIWEQVGVVAGRARKKIDHELRDRFVAACTDAGFIRPMDRELLDDKLAVIDSRISGLMVDRSGGPNIAKQLERAVAKRAAMVEDWETQFGGDDA